MRQPARITVCGATIKLADTMEAPVDPPSALHSIPSSSLAFSTPPSPATDERSAEDEAASIEIAAEQPESPLAGADQHSDNGVAAAAGDNNQIAAILSTPAPLPSAPAESLEQTEHNPALLSEGEETVIEHSTDAEHTAPDGQLMEAATAADNDDGGRHTDIVPTDQLSSDVLSTDAIPARDTLNEQTTASDITTDSSGNVAAVQPGAEPAVLNQQSTSPQPHAPSADSGDKAAPTKSIVPQPATSLFTILSPPPRTALHTAVPAVLTTFLTATDDISNTPTADSIIDDSQVHHSAATELSLDALPLPNADSTPPVAFPPSALIPSLSTSALASLLDFRSSGSSLSAVSSSSSLTVALRALKHVLDHPLLPPARPDDRRGYQFDTLSKQRRAQVGEARRSSHRYDEMGSKLSEHDKLHRRLQEELAVIQQESSALAAQYPLDPLNASMLQADCEAKYVRLPRKERLDYVSAEHSQAINRVQRDRKKLKEDEAMSDLLTAVSSPPPQHILPPLTASTHRSRQSSSVSSIAMQPAVFDSSDWT